MNEVLGSGRLSGGPVLETFEREFAERIGSGHAVAVSSGTAGLHASLIALGVKRGDIVLTTPFSFVATANVALYEGATPLFVDIDPATLEMQPAATADAIDALARGSRAIPTQVPRIGMTRGPLSAIIPVHVFGNAANLDRTIALAGDFRIPVVEDACEALGAKRRGEVVGHSGDASVFAFYPNKQITSGEGGMVVTDRTDVARVVRSLRNQGRGEGATAELHERLGFNYRLDELSAAVGLAQLRRLDEILELRARVADRYTARFAGSPLVSPLPPVADGDTRSWFVYPVRLHESIHRTMLIRRMAAHGITTRAYFWPIHLQPFYRERFGYREGDFPNAEAVGRTMLALPFHTRLADEDVDRVCEVLEAEIEHCRPASRAAVFSRA